MRKHHRFTRRDFLKTAVAVAATVQIVPRHVLGGPAATAPNDKLTRAVIGVGGMGRGHLGYIPEVELLAVCDVDANHLAKAVELGGKSVKGYKDFQEILARKDIDIVHIPTPPHWHGYMSVAAAKAGKDIWCEKPMTRTIFEGEQVRQAVQQHERIFRLNTWFRFRDNFYGMGVPVAPIKKAVAAGLVGWPVRVTLNQQTGFEWKMYWSGRTDLKPEPVPPELDYDRWLGPAPVKPYHPHRVHGTFRGYWDYDGGGLGDMGQHYLDPVQYILGKDNDSPVEIEPDTDPQHADAAGPWRRLRLKYADGCEIILDADNKDKEAAFISGPEGTISKGLASNITGLKEKIASLPEPEEQVTDFVKAVRERRKFALNEANGHRSCTLVNLGVIALRTGRPLKFDSTSQRFIDDPQANALVRQPMREPWTLG